MNEDWNIQSRSAQCAITGKPFEDKEVFHTILTFSSETGYHRRDISDEAWKAGADRSGMVSYWQAIYQAPTPPPPEPLQKETAETLLRKLIASEDIKSVNATYILAVMLERKRILRHRDTLHQDGHKTLVYEHLKTQETFFVRDPMLKLSELEAVQDEVLVILTGGPAAPLAEAQGNTEQAAENTGESTGGTQ